MSPRRRTLPLCVLLGLFAAQAAPALTPHEANDALQFPLAVDLERTDTRFERLEDTAFAGSAGLPAGWMVRTNPATNTMHIAYGGGVSLTGPIASEAAAVAAARAFLAGRGELATTAENLELRDVVRARGKWVVHFRQIFQGLPVHRGQAFVAMGEAGGLMAFGSDFFPELAGVPARPALSGADAIAAAAGALATEPGAAPVPAAELLWVPFPAGSDWTLRLAYRVTFESEEPFGFWESWVDALDGEILGRTNRIDMVNVIGNVDAVVQDFGYCDGESTQGVQNLRVLVTGGNNDVTDDDGNFDIDNAGAGDVLVSAQLLGPFLNVNRYGGLGADASWLGGATPGVPFTISWTDANARQDERDCFFHANRAHDFVTAIEPGFTGLDFPMVCVVGRTDGFCPGNAWWSPGSSSINFCEAGSGYANTGEIGNVVYHEYGHGVNDYLYAAHGSNLPSGDMHEGNADVIANFIDRNPVIGYGFVTCASGIRNADNDLQWPEDNNGGHFGGQIIAGFYWDSWQSLLAAKPQAEADDIAWSAWHFSRALGTPITQPDQVFWTFVADDDDADLSNGTPNYEHFCLGADNHGFECPAITAGVFITHEKLSNTEDGTQGFDVNAVIVSTVTSLDPAQLIVEYQVNDGGFASLLMTPTGNPDEFTAHLPALGQFSEVEYYISAADLAGNSKTDPIDAPSVVHAFDVAFEVDDLESGIGGWTIGAPGDDASEGIWQLIDPVGTLAQPEDDATPGSGTMAFVTGQCADGEGSCTFCSLTCNDVDGGKTTLLSPVYDLAGASAAKVKYDRWYSNDTWLSPGFDDWIVDVSNDGGATWTNFENTSQSNAAWISFEIDVNALFGTPGQVRLRFIASDTGNDSAVEAGVDEFRVLADLGSVGVEPGAQAPLAFSLSQNQPNPFRPATRIDYAIPERANVELAVYNVSGQRIRTLADAPHAPGRYHVGWDGRDATGQKVAAGVYFYRLSAGPRTITKKMTVLP